MGLFKNSKGLVMLEATGEVRVDSYRTGEIFARDEKTAQYLLDQRVNGKAGVRALSEQEVRDFEVKEQDRLSALYAKRARQQTAQARNSPTERAIVEGVRAVLAELLPQLTGNLAAAGAGSGGAQAPNPEADDPFSGQTITQRMANEGNPLV